MKRHSLDPVSLIFGLLFLIGGVALVVSESGVEFFEARWVFPAFLVLSGVIVLLTGRLSSSAANDASDDEVSPNDH